MAKSESASTGIKISDTIVWPKRWTTQLGNETGNAPVDNDVLVDIRAWEDRSIIIVVVRCRNAKYYGTVKTDRLHYQDVVQFLSMNMKRTLREIKQMEITFPEPVCVIVSDLSPHKIKQWESKPRLR